MTHATTGRLAAGAALLALAGCATQATPPVQQAEAPKTVSEQLIDGFEGVFGVNAGARRSGAKGFCATGEFIGGRNGARFSTATTLQRNARSPVVARFSLGGGNPNAPDNAPSVRGLALSLAGPGNEQHEFVLINTPVFSARTPESFLNYLKVRAPDPATKATNAQAVAAANAANPDWIPQIAYLRDTPPPTSFATAPYFGVNTFVFTDRAGVKRPARWTFEPVAGRAGLTAEERTAKGANFLQTELRERVATKPAEWRVLLQLPKDGDPLNDAVAAWPADRETIEVGRLRITGVQPAGAKGECDGQLFNPTLLPRGIDPSEDPVLAIRAEVYAVSLSRRSQ